MSLYKHTLRRHLEKGFAEQELAQWFDPLDIIIDETDHAIHVRFPHAFFGQWFMKARKEAFEERLAPYIHAMRIVYDEGRVSGDKRSAHPDAVRAKFSVISPDGGDRKRPHFFDARSPAADATDQASAKNPHLLLERYSFDSFIRNKKNDFPLAAAREAVENAFSPASIPFIIYGQSGSGKTHLLGSMANALQRQAPRTVFFYGSADYLRHVLRSSPASLQERAVFLDDMQKIYHNQELQDALITLIDMFQVLRRLLVLCSDTHPAGHPQVSAKLLSLLGGGVSVELKKPDLDVRMQYLQQKNAGDSLDLSRKNMLSLAQNYQDIRSIDGALAKISLRRSLTRHFYKNTDSFLKSFMEEPLQQQPLLTLDVILETVAAHFSVSTEELTGKKRDKSVALARPAAMLLCRELLGFSLVRIGQIFSGRDHSSILYSLNKIKSFQKNDKDANMKITALKQMCLSRRE